jgi:hypothetical protein
MPFTVPRAIIVLDYKIYFGEAPPLDRISIIKHISKDSMLCEIAALNYRLRPENRVSIDSSLETQMNELRYFTKTERNFIRYKDVYNKFIRAEKDYPNIFNRHSCLFAMEEISNSLEMSDVKDFEMTKDVWISILNYLLAVNFETTKIMDKYVDKRTGFEVLNPKLIPSNELYLEEDLFFILYRGTLLLEYFCNSSKYSDEINKYFQKFYGVNPIEFINNLINIFVVKSSKNSQFNFFRLINEGSESMYEKLSKRHVFEELFKLLSLKKSPIIKIDKLKYIISDNTFLIEKSYSHLLNDFWFDWLENVKNIDGSKKYNVKDYRGAFGYFFEDYVKRILINCFENYKYSILLTLDQLKVATPKGSIEIADIYFRYGNKVLLGQVKGGSIYDNEKYGGNIDALYNSDREKFFKRYGVNQVAESVIKMDKYIKMVDPSFPVGKTYHIFPCVIVNEKAFQTPLMADVFNKYFLELIKSSDIKKVKIKPLTLIHISDIERLENFLVESPKKIWNLLKYHHRERRFVPPFYNTINQKNFAKRHPDRIINYLKGILTKYN